MAAFYPLAGLAEQAIANAESAIANATLNLGVPVEVLLAQISVGDLLTATVLAPQGGQDLLEILGQRVIAQLPPDVRPGEQLVLQVTGFESNRILVRNLGIADPSNPPASLDIELPPQSTPGLSAAAAPPREVFVAASVQSGPLPAGPLPDPATRPAAPPQEADLLEARIATARIASSDLQAAADAGAFQAREAPPMIVRPVAPALSRASADPVATPSNILRILRIAQTPLTLAAAQAASSAVARFPAVLTRLQAALPQSSKDPRVATLRTLIGFLERLDPRNEHAFIDQLSSFVNNVLEGAEAKLSALLRAHVTVDAAALLPKAVPAASAHQGTIAPPASEQTDSPPDSPIESVVTLTAQAKAVERSIAIDHDLKSLVLSLVRTPPAQATQALSQALSDTLTTLTGAQLTTLFASASDPTMLTLNLPVFFQEGGRPSQVRISRDARQDGAKLDADNFHVAFVLDTKTLGTVAIDLETVGRAVKVKVNAEHSAAADRFRVSLGDLQDRLEQLRYKVASIGAQVAARGAAPILPEVQPARGVELTDGHLDIQA